MVKIKAYGIDLSNHNQVSLGQMRKLYQEGARFMIAKISEGTSYVDPLFIQHVNNAKAVGMQVAGYHFARFAGDEKRAVKEADFAVNLAQRTLASGALIACDYELDASSSRRANTVAIKTFMRVVKNRGYAPMYYSYKPYTESHVDLASILKEFPKAVWMAGYPLVNRPAYQVDNLFKWFPSAPGIQIWQYTDNWHGYHVDGNVLIGDWPVAESIAKPVKAKAEQRSCAATYTVRPGDTLTEIAKRFGSDWQRLADLNGLMNPNLIKVGQVLTLPCHGNQDMRRRDGFKVGQWVRLQPYAQRWQTGQQIPAFAKNKTYRILQVKPVNQSMSRQALLLAGVMSWALAQDVQ